jgi:alpha-galactosidase
LLWSGESDPLLVGFDGGRSHDGTLRLRPGADGPELWVEAYLGGAVLPPGSTRDLHGVTSAHGADGCALLEGWADALGTRENARRTAPYEAGWCPWYQYFHDITEATLRDNLAACEGWPIEVFQVDDGYQRAIGDWLATNARFPSGLDRLATDISGAGFVPGLWLAPFLAAPESTVARAHAPWLARTSDGSAPLPGMFNAHWSQAQGGVVWALDTTHPEVRAHLVQLARDLRQQGWRYFKLDFTMAAAFEGTFHDATRTPAERVRAGYDAFREGAGEDALILACGAPMGHVVGVADAARIGCDVAPTWGLGPDALPLGPYDPTQPSTRHALRDTLARSFMHRRLWVNDPDCVMLRRTDTALTDAQRRTWAHAVGLSGGLAVLSDDMARLDGEARALFDEVLALGRAADGEAQAGRTPRCPNLLAPTRTPTLTSAAGTLEVSLETGEGTLARG